MTQQITGAMVSYISNEPTNKRKEIFVERNIKSGKIDLYTDCRDD